MSDDFEHSHPRTHSLASRQGAKDAKGCFSEPPSDVDQLAYATIGAAIEVHRNLGPGFLESIDPDIARRLWAWSERWV